MYHFLVYFWEWGNKRFSIKLGINRCGLFLFRWIWDYSINVAIFWHIIESGFAKLMLRPVTFGILFSWLPSDERIWTPQLVLQPSDSCLTIYGLRLKCRPIIQCMNAILYCKPLSKLILCFFLNEQDNLQSQQTNSHTKKKLLVVCLHFKLMTKCWMRRKRNPIC